MALREMKDGISPPPLKRRRMSDSDHHAEMFFSEFTIYSWNVNGIAPFLQPSIASFFDSQSALAPKRPTASCIRDFLRRHGWPTVLCLQEVKINPEDAATVRALKRAVRRSQTEPLDAPQYTAHVCLPSDKYNALGFGRKIYGVCTVVRDDFLNKYVDRIRHVDWDMEGRFLVLETVRNAVVKADPSKLAIINVYAVNGTDFLWKSPETGKILGTRHDRKLEVHRLLQEECRVLESQGFGVIIAGDLNIARSTLDGHPNLRTFPKQHCLNRADFERRFFQDAASSVSSPVNESPGSNGSYDRCGEPRNPGSCLNMIDTFRQLYPRQESYTYYPRTKSFGESCDRVDMVIISRTLAGRLVEAGMHETPVERGSSDHVPLFAKMHLDFEFNAQEQINASPRG